MKTGPKPREGVTRNKQGQILCSHSRTSYNCKECKALGVGGGGICEHDVRRTGCKPCKGSQICEHNRQRGTCRECGGNQICEHGKIRTKCRECDGGAICEHDRERVHCSICRPDQVYRRYKKVAEKRKIPFHLSLEQFALIVSQPCYYCGESTEPRGVDRWDNSINIGYEFENCRPCCAVCNRWKSDMGGPAFIEHLRRAADHTSAIEDANFQQFYQSLA
jgi:hypothetical protein